MTILQTQINQLRYKQISGKTREINQNLEISWKDNIEGKQCCRLYITNSQIKQFKSVTCQLHLGLVHAPKPQRNWIYGKKTDVSDKAGELFRLKPDGIKELINDINAQKYVSHIKEPFDTIPTRNFNWPEESKSDGFSIGQYFINFFIIYFRSNSVIKSLFNNTYMRNQQDY